MAKTRLKVKRKKKDRRLIERGGFIAGNTEKAVKLPKGDLMKSKTYHI